MIAAMRFLVVHLIAVLTLAIISSNAFGQQNQDRGGGEVLMLEEIRIEVAPELPTIVVTIPRQKPEIAPVILQKNAGDLIRQNPTSIKPRLSDLVINRIEEPEKMLAKERAQ